MISGNRITIDGTQVRFGNTPLPAKYCQFESIEMMKQIVTS